MPYKFNVFTGTLDLVTAPDEGDIVGPPSSTDKAITRWSGTTGTVINDSEAILQDGGAIEAQAFITRAKITDDVAVHADEVWIAPALELTLTGSVVIDPDGEIVIVE